MQEYNNMTELIYYVYEYIKDDGMPYYIGMGHGNRIHDAHKNVVTPSKQYRRIIKDNMSEK